MNAQEIINTILKFVTQAEVDNVELEYCIIGENILEALNGAYFASSVDDEYVMVAGVKCYVNDDIDMDEIGDIIPYFSESLEETKIKGVVDFLLRYGSVDGDHHKMWVIDQAIRVLAGKEYSSLIEKYCDGEDGPETYSWDTGIAP